MIGLLPYLTDQGIALRSGMKKMAEFVAGNANMNHSNNVTY
jgi:hypothetical protein